MPAEFEAETDQGVQFPVPPECEQFVTRDKGTFIFGRLRTASALSFWKNILKASCVVLAWITLGFALSFVDGPPIEREMVNSPSCFGDSVFGRREVFVSEAIVSLVGNGAAVKTDRAFLKVVSPLSVVEQRDKLRLIHDLSYVNGHLDTPKFRYENLQDVSQLFVALDCLISIDLMSAYHHVTLAESAYPYMGFCWEKQYYYFRVLPFGLAPAPYVFSKVLRPLVEHWRSMGIKVLPYLDDFLFGADKTLSPSHPLSIYNVRHQVLGDFQKAGWLVSATKVKLEPTTVIEHLGLILDFERGVFRVPLRRWSAFQRLVAKAIQGDGYAQARFLARIAGTAQSFRLALGPVVSFYCRHLYWAVDSRRHWDARVHIGAQAFGELCKWRDMNPQAHVQPIWRSVVKFSGNSETVHSDAGDHGWGGVLRTSRGVFPARGYLSLEHRGKSSTFRELWAFLQVLKSFEGQFQRGQELVWYSDSLNAVTDMRRGGSGQPEIHDLCVEIFELVCQLGINVKWEWVPRAQNKLADALAGEFDKDDWMLHRGVFWMLSSLWGPFSMDRFASAMNAQLRDFNSFRWCPGTRGVDAFAQSDWLCHANWCNPPFWLIGRLVMFLSEIGAAAVVVVPFWVGAPWWRILCPDGVHWARFVRDWRVLLPSVHLFSSGFCSGNEGGVRVPGYKFFALRVSFRRDDDTLFGPRCTRDGVDCDCGAQPQLVLEAPSG